MLMIWCPLSRRLLVTITRPLRLKTTPRPAPLYHSGECFRLYWSLKYGVGVLKVHKNTEYIACAVGAVLGALNDAQRRVRIAEVSPHYSLI